MAGKNRFGLVGKTVLITGGCQGLGFEIAQNMSREGMQVIIADIQKKKGVESAEKLKKDGGNAEFFYVDLSSLDSVKNINVSYMGLLPSGIFLILTVDGILSTRALYLILFSTII